MTLRRDGDLRAQRRARRGPLRRWLAARDVYDWQIGLGIIGAFVAGLILLIFGLS